MKPKYTCIWYAQIHLNRWKCCVHQGYRNGDRLTLAFPCNKARRKSKQRLNMYLQAIKKQQKACDDWNKFSAEREARQRAASTAALPVIGTIQI